MELHYRLGLTVGIDGLVPVTLRVARLEATVLGVGEEDYFVLHCLILLTL